MEKHEYDALSIGDMKARSEQTQEADDFFHLGLKCIEVSSFADAVESFRSCLRKDPSNMNAACYLAQSLLEVRPQPDSEIEALLRIALDSSVAAADAVCALAHVRLEQGELKKAEELIPQLLIVARRPRTPLAHRLLSQMSLFDEIAIARPDRFQKPIVDQRVNLYAGVSSGDSLRVRIFSSLDTNYDKVAVVSVEQGDTYPGLNYDQELAESLCQFFQLTLDQTLFVVHFEIGISGPHFTGLRFFLETLTSGERERNVREFLKTLAQNFGIPLPKLSSTSEETHSFLRKELVHLNSDLLEEICGFRFVWKGG